MVDSSQIDYSPPTGPLWQLAEPGTLDQALDLLRREPVQVSATEPLEKIPGMAWLDSSGAGGVAGQVNVTTASGAYTATSLDTVILCNPSSAFTVTLPTAVGIEGKLYYIKRVGGSGAVTVDANGTETIDGSLTRILTSLNAVTIVSDNANWHIL